MTKINSCAAMLGLAVACASPAFAQQNDMQGMQMQGHEMSGIDMPTMMKHCARMRQAVRNGATLRSDMQRMMAQCDQMDRQTGGTLDSAPPATRDR
jgi:hypothetical protein